MFGNTTTQAAQRAAAAAAAVEIKGLRAKLCTSRVEAWDLQEQFTTCRAHLAATRAAALLQGGSTALTGGNHAGSRSPIPVNPDGVQTDSRGHSPAKPTNTWGASTSQKGSNCLADVVAQTLSQVSTDDADTAGALCSDD